MKFYDCKTAPSPRRVRVFLAEKGLEVDTEQVDLGSGAQFSDAFRAVNPDCVVPALILDDGSALSEVAAICQYLEEFQPEPTLWGDDAAERARVTMWNIKVEQQGLLAMADTFRNTAKGLKGRALPGPDDFEQIPELATRGRKRVELFFEKLDQQLEGREFLASDRYSIADISAMVFIDFAQRAKIEMSEEHTNLKRWYAAVSARPSAGV